jgi:isoquinoline 1-oxidoreductase beta subunit
VLYQRGNVEEAMGEAANVLEASYEVPYLARARMEPGNATALVTDDRVDIWIGDLRNSCVLNSTAIWP